ncbi:hypothetical protein Tco_0041293, partial [Tanacetum coccineum]
VFKWVEGSDSLNTLILEYLNVNCTKLGMIVGNLVQLWVQFIPSNGTGGTKVTEHPDSDSGKREFVLLMKFSEFTLE